MWILDSVVVLGSYRGFGPSPFDATDASPLARLCII